MVNIYLYINNIFFRRTLYYIYIIKYINNINNINDILKENHLNIHKRIFIKSGKIFILYKIIKIFERFFM
jgi:hypothetical protein